ncbi:uncharacterized protein ACNLHF_002928 isoform 3-T3 [Anomaloglossus baeobatrachus]|uniref:uncharacterized protein LOC142256116 isoform X3 n=1 Tax=Anomaloglossus baeobatrachus TaxID=238106 RepID=UPI003F502CCA
MWGCVPLKVLVLHCSGRQVLTVCRPETIDILGCVFSDKCYSCVSSNSTTCNQTEIECLGSRCMTASQYFILNGTLSESMFKGCANETMCKDNGMGKVKNTKYEFVSKCCSGTLCNKEKFEPGRDTNYSCKGCVNPDGCKFNFYSKILFEEMHRELLKC